MVPGNHLQIVKPSSAHNVSVQGVLDGILSGTSPSKPATAGRLAIESRQFQQAVDTLIPHADELDDNALVELASHWSRSEEEMKRWLELLKRNSNGDDLDATGGWRGV